MRGERRWIFGLHNSYRQTRDEKMSDLHAANETRIQEEYVCKVYAHPESGIGHGNPKD